VRSAVLQIADRSVKRLLRLIGVTQAGAWHGNDTAWRMSLDLARIALYADPPGTMQDTPQRTVLSIIDGIVAGEGEGPLSPEAVKAGALIFSDDLVKADWLACKLMGHDPEKIPLVREAFKSMRYSLARGPATSGRVVSNRPADASGILPALPRAFKTPVGWRGSIEEAQVRSHV
ncbi:MAG: DUF362 domain-containing protein, partial [Deltaproteobacteria bacterium]